jgi:hypothetical protein
MGRETTRWISGICFPYWKDGARMEYFVQMDSGDKLVKILFYHKIFFKSGFKILGFIDKTTMRERIWKKKKVLSF